MISNYTIRPTFRRRRPYLKGVHPHQGRAHFKQRVGRRTVVRFHEKPHNLQVHTCTFRVSNTAERIFCNNGESFIPGEGATSLVNRS